MENWRIRVCFEIRVSCFEFKCRSSYNRVMPNPNLSVNIGKLKLRNPVIVASGTFGYAEELASLVDLKKLGVIITKTITLKPKAGNPPPRTCETPSGMLNAIGLENPGVEKFLREKLPYFKSLKVPIIVSISADNDADFIKLTKRLEKVSGICAIELNLSCPNLASKVLVSQDPSATYRVVSKVRKVTKRTLIVKLTPNVTDIVSIAKAAKNAGADAVSLVNTFLALAVDVNSRRPKLANITGGLSGPAIKPIALRMVWEVAQKINIPIIGGGGIMGAQDALEFIIAGASAVSVGTATFVNPKAAQEIIAGIEKYLKKNNIKDLKKIIGCLKDKQN